MPPLPRFQSPKPLRLLHMPRITCMVSVQNGDVVPNLEVLASSNRWPPKATPKKHEAGVYVDTFATASPISATSKFKPCQVGYCLMCPCERRSETHSSSWEVLRSFQHATYPQCRNDCNSPNSKKKQKSWEIQKKQQSMEIENESARTKDSFSKSSFLGSRFAFWGGHPP